MSSTGTEAELERFRQQWRAEVARSKRSERTSSGETLKNRAQKRKDAASISVVGQSTARRKDVSDYSEEVEPRAYHDLPDKEESFKLGWEDQNYDRNLYKEPSSALEHYEHAVEKETRGQLGDSIKHYRKAFKVRPPLSYATSTC